MRPGREHDTTALRTYPEILPALTVWTAEHLPALGDLGYEGESATITVAYKKPKGGELTEEQKTHNKTHNGKRALGERGNSLLKTTFKAHYATSASAHGASAPSSKPLSSSSTSTTTAQHDHTA